MIETTLDNLSILLSKLTNILCVNIWVVDYASISWVCDVDFTAATTTDANWLINVYTGDRINGPIRNAVTVAGG